MQEIGEQRALRVNTGGPHEISATGFPHLFRPPNRNGEPIRRQQVSEVFI